MVSPVSTVQPWGRGVGQSEHRPGELATAAAATTKERRER
jgi:hypothetical protein